MVLIKCHIQCPCCQTSINVSFLLLHVLAYRLHCWYLSILLLSVLLQSHCILVTSLVSLADGRPELYIFWLFEDWKLSHWLQTWESYLWAMFFITALFTTKDFFTTATKPMVWNGLITHCAALDTFPLSEHQGNVAGFSFIEVNLFSHSFHLWCLHTKLTV